MVSIHSWVIYCNCDGIMFYFTKENDDKILIYLFASMIHHNESKLTDYSSCTNWSESYFYFLAMHGTGIYGKWGYSLNCKPADKCYKWMVFLHCLHVCRQYVSVTTKYEKMIFCICCNMVPVNSPSHTPLEYYLYLAKQNNPLFVPKHGLLHLGVHCKLLVLTFLVLVVG